MQNVVFDQVGDEERCPRSEYSDSAKVPEEDQKRALIKAGMFFITAPRGL